MTVGVKIGVTNYESAGGHYSMLGAASVLTQHLVVPAHGIEP